MQTNKAASFCTCGTRSFPCLHRLTSVSALTPRSLKFASLSS
ncbi:hypothetical protein FG173_04560 [Serratia marcescens]|nr:SWIM zinc finger family protein [Serratia marcescens]QDI46382.1 hypothetical protein FG173_04560 [Serratia marcescens]